MTNEHDIDRDAFGVNFNMLKIKYNIYEKTISDLGKIQPNDKINVFLNLETCLKYLSMDNRLENKLVMDINHSKKIAAHIINLAAHYKRFFRDNNMPTKVYIYMTDLDSDMDSFKECEYNSEYRTHYLCKFNGNARYAILTKSLKKEIFPIVKTICEFIPDVYFISSKNIDGSLVPLIINNEYDGWTNYIVSGDSYETQYSFMDNFTHHLYSRGYVTKPILECTLKGYLMGLNKLDSIENADVELMKNKSFYRLFLASNGDATRSIEGIKGIGFRTLVKILNKSISDKTITRETESIDILSEAFQDYQKDEIIENFKCFDIENTYKLLTKGDIKSITSQIIDRSDINSFRQLNNQYFIDVKINEEDLFS